MHEFRPQGTVVHQYAMIPGDMPTLRTSRRCRRAVTPLQTLDRVAVQTRGRCRRCNDM